ncbi:YopX family protein [Hoylesella timonensis]|uniref:YopX protein domain-containing protein n=1 Tax=Hoylesella timonensis CRIS 5C-B1 TaxID=679189 RepID=D1VXG7_9BACT|nr:YopX family protein [Hoylesella timonensis]EFA98127.1 phage conserved hypothetical protein TIGR01671 [Hoylesella timonensis CRIS 5C-B1]
MTMAKREILFRGWNKKNKKWIYGYYFAYRGYHFISPDDKVNPLDTYEDYVIDADTVGQYTGLKDAKGTKIFEGDILGGDILGGDGRTHVIQYNEENSRFEAARKLSPERSQLSWLFQFDINQDWIDEHKKVVIGNVHENPLPIKTE